MKRREMQVKINCEVLSNWVQDRYDRPIKKWEDAQ